MHIACYFYVRVAAWEHFRWGWVASKVLVVGGRLDSHCIGPWVVDHFCTFCPSLIGKQAWEAERHTSSFEIGGGRSASNSRRGIGAKLHRGLRRAQ